MSHTKTKNLMILALCSFLLLSGCIPAEAPNNTSVPKLPLESVENHLLTFSHNEQEFEIIPFYKEILEYIAQTKEHGPENMERMYYNHVLEPLRLSAWGDKSSHSVNHYLITPTTNLNKLEEYTYLLLQDQEHINELIKDSLIHSADVLSAQKTKKIYLFPFQPDYDYVSEWMDGIEGYAYDQEVIILMLDPERLLKSILRTFVASRYYDTVYSEGTYSRIPTLLDSVILKGKSSTFSQIIYPDIDVQWIAPLSKKGEALVWNAMAELLSKPISTANLYFDFTSGDPGVGIPPWSDYKIGYQIIQDFIKNNPDVSIEDWTQMNASEILEKSRFEERFGS